MNSSISPSKYNFSIFIGALFGAYFLGAFYTLHINPETDFWKHAYAIKKEAAEQLAKKGKKTIFVGGSSSAFQIDPELLQREFSIPAVNFGMHAGMGARMLVLLGVQAAEAGDELVLNIEPDLLVSDRLVTPLGYQTLVALGEFNMLGSFRALTKEIEVAEIFISLRPGLKNTVTMLAKMAAGRPMYRYRPSDVHKGGYITTEERGFEAIQHARVSRVPSKEAKEFLKELSSYAKTKNVTLIYLLPWTYVPVGLDEETRESFRSFSEEVEKIIPVLNDGSYGVDSDISEFADTANHLNELGAERRTRLLGRILEK